MEGFKIIMNKLTAINIRKKVEKIKHSELERTGESPFRSVCPFCKEGTLLVQREKKTLKLKANDFCILCGQHVIYSDINDIKDWHNGS